MCWKNLIAVRGLFGNKMWWIMLVCFLAPMSLPLLDKGTSIAAGVAMMLLGMSPMLLLMGPHILRCDLRQDLSSLDVLKPLPLRGWQMILGEVMAPVTVLRLVERGVRATVALLAGVAGPGDGSPPPELVSGGLPLLAAVAVLLPAFNFVSVLLLNGVAVLFPAWQGSLTGMGARGVGAMGAHLLLMLGHFLGLLLLLLVPAGLGTGAAFVLVGGGLPWPWAVLPASLLAVLLLTAEAAGVLLMLGDRFERLDLSDEPEM